MTPRTAAARERTRTYLLRAVPEDLWQGLRRKAYERETTLREVILAAVREHLSAIVVRAYSERDDQGRICSPVRGERTYSSDGYSVG